MTSEHDEPTVVLELSNTPAQTKRASAPARTPDDGDAPTVKLPAVQLPAAHRQRYGY